MGAEHRRPEDATAGVLPRRLIPRLCDDYLDLTDSSGTPSDTPRRR
jgi:hypothetical protein